MSKKRIYELAKELNVNSKDIIKVAEDKGFSVGNHMSVLGENEERQIREFYQPKKKAPAQKTNNNKKNEHAKKAVAPKNQQNGNRNARNNGSKQHSQNHNSGKPEHNGSNNRPVNNQNNHSKNENSSKNNGTRNVRSGYWIKSIKT